MEEILKNGGVAVIPTDTVYGIVGSAMLPETVERIFNLRQREKDKPMIVLISSLEDLKKFQIDLTPGDKEALKKVWPGKVSVVMDCSAAAETSKGGQTPVEKFAYLHRGTKTIAFRMPADVRLQELLEKVGPLVAPSANISGEPVATTIAEARVCFGNNVDWYEDGGEIKGRASTLVRFANGKFEVMRQGDVVVI